MHKVKIDIGGFDAGLIEINDKPEHFGAQRTATGFSFSIPMSVSFKAVPQGYGIPLISNLRGTILAADRDNRNFEVGQLREERQYQGSLSGTLPTTGHLTWSGTFAELAAYERIREGREARFQIQFRGEGCFLLSLPSPYNRHLMRTDPHSFDDLYVAISFAIEVWTRKLREIGVVESLVLEIPLTSSPPSPWDEVWKAVSEARESIERGGSTGWNSCVGRVRLALEKWQKIPGEEEDKGPGWVPPKQPDREARTKKQRLDNLRWHLMQCAHQGPHTSADDWTRDDAILMLSTLAALLAERNP